MPGNAIKKIVSELIQCGGKKQRLNYIEKYLKDISMNCNSQKFKFKGLSGTNLIINQDNNNKILLSAHHDGGDPNDNLSSLAVLLYMLKIDNKNNLKLKDYTVIFTDLEESGAVGIIEYIKEYDAKLPAIFLELSGIGDIIHICTDVSFGEIRASMNQELNTQLQNCAKKLNYNFKLHCSPPGDHLHYADNTNKGKAALISIAYDLDFEIMRRMFNNIQPDKLFDGLDANAESTLKFLPPFGKSSIAMIQENALEKIYKILECFILNMRKSSTNFEIRPGRPSRRPGVKPMPSTDSKTDYISF